MRTRLTTLNILLAGFVAWAAPAEAEDAQEILNRLRARYGEAGDFRADIVVATTNAMGATVTQTGVLFVRQPNLFRVEFASPYAQTVVYDGRYMFVVTPSSGRVLRYEGGGFASFLNMPGALDELETDYAVALKSSTGATDYVLEFTPRGKSLFKKITLYVHPGDMIVSRADLYDCGGGLVSYKFSRYAFNVGTPASRFRYVAPEGAEVVDMGAAGL